MPEPNQNPKWLELLEEIKTFFPAPWKEEEKDRSFENQVRLALRLADEMKHSREECYLGDSREPDFEKARNARMRTEMTPPEKVIEELVQFLDGLLIWNHPRTMENVQPPTTIASVIGNTLGAAFNPNIIQDEDSWRVAASEIEAASLMAQIIGYDPQLAGGIFTFGGTGCYLYATKLALTKCLGVQSRYEGVRTDAQVLVSRQGHYCKQNCTDWTGLGMNNLREIDVDQSNRMSVRHLKEVMRQCHEEGKPIAMVVCTVGTTDAFAVDPIREVREAIDDFTVQYGPFRKPLLYADAAIGWAWAAFRDYDFAQNPLQFSDGAAGVLKYCSDQVKDLPLADAIGCDLHKTGWAPYISSLFMVRDYRDFQLLRRESAGDSYLYNFGSYHPGKFTLETSRPGTYSLAGWANLRLFGLQGLQVMLGNLIEVEVALRNQIRTEDGLVCVNPEDHGIVTIFRVYPPGVNTEEQYYREFNYEEHREELLTYNEFQVAVANEIHRMRASGENAPAIGLTKAYRSPLYASDDDWCKIVALKAYPMSPHSDAKAMATLVEYVLKARDRVVKAAQEKYGTSHAEGKPLPKPLESVQARNADPYSPAVHRWGSAEYVPVEFLGTLPEAEDRGI